jgi:hypothetical protein
MWLTTTKGFISVVEFNDDSQKLLVRARNPEHIAAAFPDAEIIENASADYRWRAIVSRLDVADFAYEAAMDIDYSSHVKEAVSGGDDDLYRAMLRTWNAFMDYQEKVLKRQVSSSTSLDGGAHADTETGLELVNRQECPECFEDLEYDEMTGEWFCPSCELEGADEDIDTEPVADAVRDAVKRIAGDKPVFSFKTGGTW